MFQDDATEQLDPRRRPRGRRTRDWASMSRTVTVPQLLGLLQERVALLLVQLGLVR